MEINKSIWEDGEINNKIINKVTNNKDGEINHKIMVGEIHKENQIMMDGAINNKIMAGVIKITTIIMDGDIFEISLMIDISYHLLL